MSGHINNSRLSWERYFLGIVDAVSKRATCERGMSAAIIVQDNYIISTGYVGAPSGAKHCLEVGHLFEEKINKNGITSKHCVRTIHAEQNALANATRLGISVKGSTLYCTMEPCFNCAKLIVASGIKKVVSKYKYHAAENTRNLFISSHIELKVINQSEAEYKDNSVSNESK